MSVSRCGARVSAAAFVLGLLSLAGPWVATAVAGGGDGSAALSDRSSASSTARDSGLSEARTGRAVTRQQAPRAARVAAGEQAATGSARPLPAAAPTLVARGRTATSSAAATRARRTDCAPLAALVASPVAVAVAAPSVDAPSVTLASPSVVSAKAVAAPSASAPRFGGTLLGIVAEINRSVRAFTANPLISVQTASARVFNNLRDLSNFWLPSPLADMVNGGLFLVRRLLLPTGADVDLFGHAACVSAGDCSGRDLTGAQLDRQDLTGVKWAGATLRLANLRGAALKNAPPTATFNAVLTAASQVAANSTPSCYPNCQQADLQGADLSGADLANADLYWANLNFANLSYASLDSANLDGAFLAGADAEYAFFAGASMIDADLSSANLVGTSMIYANLGSANLDGVTLTGGATLWEATLTGATLIGANLSGATLASVFAESADLSNANLSDANLTDANLGAAILTGANLTGATLSGVFWDDATCPNGTVTYNSCSA